MPERKTPQLNKDPKGKLEKRRSLMPHDREGVEEYKNYGRETYLKIPSPAKKRRACSSRRKSKRRGTASKKARSKKPAGKISTLPTKAEKRQSLMSTNVRYCLWYKAFLANSIFAL